jgi:hypothetical protein
MSRFLRVVVFLAATAAAAHATSYLYAASPHDGFAPNEGIAGGTIAIPVGSAAGFASGNSGAAIYLVLSGAGLIAGSMQECLYDGTPSVAAVRFPLYETVAIGSVDPLPPSADFDDPSPTLDALSPYRAMLSKHDGQGKVLRSHSDRDPIPAGAANRGSGRAADSTARANPYEVELLLPSGVASNW